MIEPRESAPRGPQFIEEALSRFLDGETDAAVTYLRQHREEVSEFCLRVREQYAETDRATPILELARLIEALL